jgi:hypothetical protein
MDDQHMTQFLANCEVEAHLSLAEGNKVMRYDHPTATYTVFLRDQSVEPGSDPPLLSAQMVFAAPSLREAKFIVQDHMKEFLDYLTLVTNCKFRLHKILQVFNWEPGNGMREAIYYAGSADHNIPMPAISGDLFNTIALMQAEAISTRLRRALKWFGNAVASVYQDDQFTYFWFVIEVLAQIIKEPTPVPDRCPVCRGPLHCPACGISHLHRPYPKQAIQQLFAKHVNNGWEKSYAVMNDVRNRLMHGEEVKTIEADLKISFAQVVDDLGKVAWVAIINQFVPRLAGKGVHFIETNTYVHLNMSMGAHIQVGFMPNFNDPKPEHFPKVQLTMTSRPATPPRGENIEQNPTAGA